MRKVIFCDNLKSVDDKIFIDCDVAITAYAAMSITLRKLLRSIGTKAPILPMAKVQRSMFPYLDNKNSMIQNKLIASKIIDNINGNKEHKLRFQNDIDNIMASIKLLIECGVDIDKLLKNNPNQDEILFSKIFKRICLEDNYINYIATVNKYKNYPSTFEEDFIRNIKFLCNELEKKSGSKGIEFEVVNKRILLIGYYIITPPQEMIFSFLEKCGYELVFVLHYNPKLKKVNDIINITYDIDLVTNKYTTYGKYEMNLATIFDMLLDNKNLKNTLTFDLDELSKKVFFRIYHNRYEYQKENIKLLKNNELILSCNPKENINEMLNIDSRIDKKRVSIKNYSIGQFIYEIYKMWDPIRGKLVLDAERIQKCFATKLVVNVDGENAFNYIYDFILIKDYYRHNETISDWKVALSDLRDNLNDKKVNKIVGYGPKIVGVDNVTRILKFITIIEEIAKLIFGNEDYEMDLKSHLIILERVINRTSHNVEDNFIVEELLDRIKKLLENNTITSIRVGNKYLLETITGYLSHINIEEADEDYDSDELVNDGMSKLLKVDTIESFLYSDYSKIYINDINKDTFIKKGELTFPLKVTRFRDLLEDDFDELSEKLIKRMLIIVDYQAEASRYFYWLLLNFKGEIVFSKFEDFEDDSAHFYERELMTLLKKEYDEVEIERKNGEEPGFKIPYKRWNSIYKRELYLNEDKVKFCFIRGLLDSYIDECYAEAYQIEIALANLLYSIAENPQLSRREAGKYIEKLSPGLSHFRKNEVYNFYNKIVEDNQNNNISTEKAVVLNKTVIDLENDFKKFKTLLSSNNSANNVGNAVEEFFENLRSGIIPKGVNQISHCRECPFRLFCMNQVYEERSE